MSKAAVLDKVTRARRLDPSTVTAPSADAYAVASAPIKYLHTISMTPEAWHAIPDNPRQRDTVERAKRSTHLHKLHPSHVKMNMAKLPDGSLFKLDGHTRAFLWHEQRVPAPSELSVDVWYCENLDQVRHLYTTFDSTKAAEQMQDKVFGGQRDLGISFESPLFRRPRWGSAVLSAEALLGNKWVPSDDIYVCLIKWRKELALLDQCAPTQQRFPRAVITAALLTFRKYGKSVQDFWADYASGSGTKLDGLTDPVQAFEERLLRMRASHGWAGWSALYEIVGVAISAVERWRSGRKYQRRDDSESRKYEAGIKKTGAKPLRRWLNDAAKVPIAGGEDQE